MSIDTAEARQMARKKTTGTEPPTKAVKVDRIDGNLAEREKIRGLMHLGLKRVRSSKAILQPRIGLPAGQQQ